MGDGWFGGWQQANQFTQLKFELISLQNDAELERLDVLLEMHQPSRQPSPLKFLLNESPIEEKLSSGHFKSVSY